MTPGADSLDINTVTHEHVLLLHDQCAQVFELTAINGTNYETRHSSSVHTVRGDSLMFSLAPAVASEFACCAHTVSLQCDVSYSGRVPD